MKKASDLLQSFFLKHGIEEGQKYVSFFRQWENIVGDDVAAHAEVEDIRNEALVVRVDHPAWMQILHMKKDVVLRKVNEQFPDLSVSTIHMHLDSEPRRRVPRQTERSTTTGEDECSDSENIDSANVDSSNKDAIQGTRLESLLGSLGKQVRERNRKRES